MKNNLADLNNILFVQLERLQDDEVCSDREATETEIRKTETINKVAEQIISIGNLQLNALKIQMEYGVKNSEVSNLLENKRNA